MDLRITPSVLTFPPDEIAKGGYALEAAIFGGILEGKIAMTTRQYAKQSGLCRQAKLRVREGKYVKNALTLTQWPSGIYQHSYHAGNAIMGSRRQLEPFDEVVRVPISFLGDLFSENCWKKKAVRRTLGPLDVPARGKWLVGMDVCDVDDPSLDEGVRARLSAIIAESNVVKGLRPETKADVRSAVIQSNAARSHQTLLRSNRMVAIFGYEMRQVAETGKGGNITVFVVA